MTKIENPILPGFNPDPSIVRVEGDYYIATSTFEWFPGVCIHHSKDLVNWEIVSYALTDEKYFNITGIDSACGIWAPNLTYNDGRFYLVYTIVYTNRHRFKDTHNFLMTTRDIRGMWSKPVPLNKTGFDPSLFHDIDGRKWLVNMHFDYRLDHKRFGGVDIQEYDPISQRLVGETKNIFKGSSIGTTEGPNIFYYNKYYYLVTAEGGTGTNHCVTICRAEYITGPYEECPYNPILTSAGSENVILKRAGHGQIVDDGKGNWYMAHLCSRSVDNCSIMGRETAIQNMKYTKDGWFVLANSKNAVPDSYFYVSSEAKKLPIKCGKVDLSNNVIPMDYMTLRQSREALGMRVEGNTLKIRGGNSLSSKYNQCLLARRQQHLSFDFTVGLEFYPKNYCHMAGITCYYNYDNYYYLFISGNDSKKNYIEVLTMENNEQKESNRILLDEMEGKIFLKAEVRVRELQFYYSYDGERFNKVGPFLDMRSLSDERIEGNGFTGAMVGVCCQDLMGDGVEACFDLIEYSEKVCFV